ncbi:hypothetical protein ACQPZP_33370 [Spirillospora sp. CA-142024]|uniref:hypothetical protein n=1 Tax=Spirillospora sp. CA-142024 TaxID=3240036 RepID=UPI003D8FD9E2
MSVSVRASSRLNPGPGALIAAAGGASLFATYWDDAWHTDFGRDSALIPPHVVLYGAVAVAGLVVLTWGSFSLVRLRSAIGVLRRPPLLLAALGGGFTLAAAPADAAWHAAYGRDAVLWSPPHMLVVFASTTMAIGVLAGVRPTRTGRVEAALSALVLGSLTMSVMEYETNVPQFSEVLFLPVLLAAAMLAATIVRRLVPHRHAILGMVVTYALARLVITGALTLMGRSAPDVPLAIVGLAAMELPWRTSRERYAAGAAGVAAAAWASAALGIVSPSPKSVGFVAFPVLLVWVLQLAAHRLTSRTRGTAAATLIGVLVLVSPAPQARAHDPGQGEPFAPVRLSAATDGTGMTRLTAVPARRCAEMSPVKVMARRAGRQIAGRLIAAGDCRFQGTLRLPPDGLWFVYGEFSTTGGRSIETWLPVHSDRSATVTESRELYHPAGGHGITTGEVFTSVILYGLGLSLLGTALALTRRPSAASDAGE